MPSDRPAPEARRRHALSRDDIYAAVWRERVRQDDLWGPKPPLDEWPWPKVLLEEVGEMMRADLEGDAPHFVEECIHAIAVLFAIVETV